jgi:hypothetical protein
MPDCCHHGEGEHDKRDMAMPAMPGAGAENDGWQKRYAQKFGLIYAAMELGVNLGLLPWSEVLPLKVATKCFDCSPILNFEYDWFA